MCVTAYTNGMFMTQTTQSVYKRTWPISVFSSGDLVNGLFLKDILIQTHLLSQFENKSLVVVVA